MEPASVRVVSISLSSSAYTSSILLELAWMLATIVSCYDISVYVRINGFWRKNLAKLSVFARSSIFSQSLNSSGLL